MLNGRVRPEPMSVLRSSMDHRVKPGGDEQQRVKPGDDEFFRRRDAASHPSFATPRKAKPKSVPKISSLKRREAERREARSRSRIEKRCGARPFSCLPHCGRTEAQDLPWTSKNGAGALAFRRPTAASEVLTSARLGPRFLEPPDANGRTLSGTSAASTSRSDTRRTGRCPSRPRAQCIAAPDENRSRSALRSTLAKGVPLRAGFCLGNRYGDESQGLCRNIGDEGCLAQGAAFPGCSAARSGALLIRDRSGLGVCYDPGSAAHHFAMP